MKNDVKSGLTSPRHKTTAGKLKKGRKK